MLRLLAIRLVRATVSHSRLRLTIAVRLLLLLLLLILLHLRLLRRHDAKIVLGVLQVILRHYAVAGRVRVARELQVLLVDVCRRSTNLHLGAVRVERPVGVVASATTAAAMIDVATVAALRPAAASTRTFQPMPLLI